jgi:uncharacterized membrane protein
VRDPSAFIGKFRVEEGYVGGVVLVVGPIVVSAITTTVIAIIIAAVVAVIAIIILGRSLRCGCERGRKNCNEPRERVREKYAKRFLAHEVVSLVRLIAHGLANAEGSQSRWISHPASVMLNPR